MYDYLIVGAGFFSATCAHELTKKGYKVCIIDRRDHVGGNCYTEIKDEIPINMYGPQVLYTSNEEVWLVGVVIELVESTDKVLTFKF